MPGREGRLSDGLVIEACVTARLLGIRLLRIEAGVLVSPADTQPRSAAAAASAFTPSTRSRPVGARLIAAERCIEEAAARLADSRTDTR